MDLFGYNKSDDELIVDMVRSIEGLVYIPNFLSITEENEITNAIDLELWLNDLSRKVQHYGYKYDYRSRSINATFKIGSLPEWSEKIISKMRNSGLIDFEPDQLIVNNYLPGQGIALHVDCEPCFAETIVSVSLCSDIVMDFKHIPTNEKKNILLQQRSLLVLKGNARYSFEHGIAARKSDNFNSTKRLRKRRISLTFRKVILNE